MPAESSKVDSELIQSNNESNKTPIFGERGPSSSQNLQIEQDQNLSNRLGIKEQQPLPLEEAKNQQVIVCTPHNQLDQIIVMQGLTAGRNVAHKRIKYK